MDKRIMHEFQIDEISAVDKPAQAEAKVTIMKRNDEVQAEEGSPEPTEASNNLSGDSSADEVGKVHSEVTMTNENETVEQAVAQEVEELTKRLERAEAINGLSNEQRELFKGMEAEQQDEFLALDSDTRDAEVAKAADANAVVYTDASGAEYRKNDDPRLVALAKQADEERSLRMAAEEAAAAEELAKRAAAFSHVPGNVASLLKAIDSLEESEREEALEALRAHDANLGKAFEAVGSSDSPKEDSVLEDIAKRISGENPSLTPEQAYAQALETPEGMEAYNRHLGL
jgi:hypothetical protein